MGGEIRCQSEEGQGAEFTFTMRLKRDLEKTREVQAYNSNVSLDNRIACIQVEPENLKGSFVNIVSSWGVLRTELLERADVLITTNLQSVSTVPTVLVAPFGYTGVDFAKETNPLQRVIYKPVKREKLRRAILELLQIPIPEDKKDLNCGCITRPSKAPPTPTTPNETPKLRILLVDDNLINQRVALHMLNKLHQSAEVADNGLECLKKLDQIQQSGSPMYDLVLMVCIYPYNAYFLILLGYADASHGRYHGHQRDSKVSSVFQLEQGQNHWPHRERHDRRSTNVFRCRDGRLH